MFAYILTFVCFRRPRCTLVYSRLLLDQFHPPVTSRSTAKTVRYRPMFAIGSGAYRKSPLGCWGEWPISNPIRPPLPPNCGLATPSRNLHRKFFGRTVPDTMVVCIDSVAYWNITYNRPTQQYHRRPLGAPFPKRG